MATKPTWTEVDVDSLPAALAKRYEAVKDAAKAHRDAKDAFETQFRAALAKAKGDNGKALVPAGHKAVIGYNFGKLSFAIVADDTPTRTKSSAKPKFSLG